MMNWLWEKICKIGLFFKTNRRHVRFSPSTLERDIHRNVENEESTDPFINFVTDVWLNDLEQRNGDGTTCGVGNISGSGRQCDVGKTQKDDASLQREFDLLQKSASRIWDTTSESRKIRHKDIALYAREQYEMKLESVQNEQVPTPTLGVNKVEIGSKRKALKRRASWGGDEATAPKLKKMSSATNLNDLFNIIEGFDIIKPGSVLSAVSIKEDLLMSDDRDANNNDNMICEQLNELQNKTADTGLSKGVSCTRLANEVQTIADKSNYEKKNQIQDNENKCVNDDEDIDDVDMDVIADNLNDDVNIGY